MYENLSIDDQLFFCRLLLRLRWRPDISGRLDMPDFISILSDSAIAGELTSRCHVKDCFREPD